MSPCRIWIHMLTAILWIAIAGSTQAGNSSKELLPFQAMSGIITAAFEPGKILLASTDKITVELLKDYGTKPGDYLEIFQPLDPNKKGNEKDLYKRVGLGIIIERIDAVNAVCIIDSSIKEISVGDLVRVVVPR